RNPAATEGEVAEARRQGLLGAFAEIEVARGQGQGPRRFATAAALLGGELQGAHRQSLIRTNIQNAQGITADQRSQLAGMFDRHGGLQEQFTSGLGFATRVGAVLGGNETAMRNIFAGTGHGNAQSLQSNWRNVVAAMMAGGSQVQSLVQGVGRDFT